MVCCTLILRIIRLLYTFVAAALLTLMGGSCEREDDIQPPRIPTHIPDEQIVYITNDERPLEMSTLVGFGADFVSHSYNNGLGVITFSGPVTTIPKSAFKGRTSLVQMGLSESVTRIEADAFQECIMLEALYTGNSIHTIGPWAFAYCRRLTLFTLSESITAIGEGAFAHCYGLTELSLPQNLRSIAPQAFECCTALGRVIFHDGLTSMGHSAFSGCVALYDVTLPTSLLELEPYTFANCESLRSITLHKNLRSLGQNLFDGCTSLRSIYSNAATPPAGGKDMFAAGVRDRSIYVPATSVEAYQEAEFWSDYADEIKPME